MTVATATIFNNYVDGEWAPGPTFENRNPADTTDLVGLFVKGSAADMMAAADAAARAYPAWSSLPAPTRGAYLFKVAEILESQIEEIATEMTREEGKTLPESRGE